MANYTQNERLVTALGETVEFRDHTILVDTSGGLIVMNMPADPFVGETHTFKDQAFTFATNNFTVDGNGFSIEQAFINAFGPTALMNQNGESITWQFAPDTRWHILVGYKP